MAATQMRDKLAAIAAKQLNILPADIAFADGKIRSRSNPDNALPFGRVAGTAHWSPVMLPEGMSPGLSETGVWSPPELEPPTRDDRINTSLTYGFVFDMCGVEIDPVTFQVRVDRYVSMHDAGTLLNPLIAVFVRDMAKRLAADGYTVLVPNPFYRSTKAPGLSTDFDFSSPTDRAKMDAALANVKTLQTLRF